MYIPQAFPSCLLNVFPTFPNQTPGLHSLARPPSNSGPIHWANSATLTDSPMPSEENVSHISHSGGLARTWMGSTNRQIAPSSDATVCIGETFIIHARRRETFRVGERKQIHSSAGPTRFVLHMSIYRHLTERGKSPRTGAAEGRLFP